MDMEKLKLASVDAATPLIYVLAEDLGLTCAESPEQLDSKTKANGNYSKN